MKNKVILLTMTCLAMITTAWGQVEKLSEKDTIATQRILEIREIWSDNPIQVENDFPNARIRNFAKAFASRYVQYRPNEAMMDYLKKPGDYSWEEKHYYSEDLPRNGYIKCDMGGQFDYLTEMCYWRRPNGHQLVGVLMQIGYEGEKCNAVILFYDFDPKTQVMSPDTTIHQTVMKIVNNHPGSLFFELPKEGKDINVTAVRWTMEDDFVYDDFLLKWNGNSFDEAKIEIEVE